jgi:hypothetical protein
MGVDSEVGIRYIKVGAVRFKWLEEEFDSEQWKAFGFNNLGFRAVRLGGIRAVKLGWI